MNIFMGVFLPLNGRMGTYKKTNHRMSEIGEVHLGSFLVRIITIISKSNFRPRFSFILKMFLQTSLVSTPNRELA